MRKTTRLRFQKHNIPAKISDNNIIELQTSNKYTHDGRAIAFAQGYTYFISNALVNETVNARILKQSKNIIETIATEIIIANRDRIEPFCTHYLQCGGCSLQHIPTTIQIQIKSQYIQDALKHIGIEIIFAEPIVGGGNGYRRNSRISVKLHKNQTYMGFRGSNSNSIANIDTCRILTESLQLWLQELLTVLRTKNVKNIGHIEVKELNKKILFINATDNINTDTIEALKAFCINTQAAMFIKYQDQHQNIFNDDLYYIIKLYTKTFKIRVGIESFIQVNSDMNQKLVDLALQKLNTKASDVVLDLFAGSGNFSIPIASCVQEVLAVELSTNMVDNIVENSQINGLTNVKTINANLFTEDLQFLHKYIKEYSANKCLLDPPREGAKHICEFLSGYKMQNIVYVSCNASTFIRDLKILLNAEYKLVDITLVDMFAHTGHIELVALISKI